MSETINKQALLDWLREHRADWEIISEVLSGTFDTPSDFDGAKRVRELWEASHIGTKQIGIIAVYRQGLEDACKALGIPGINAAEEPDEDADIVRMMAPGLE